MAYNKYFLQKSLFASFITIVNVVAISIAYVFSQYWWQVQLPLLTVLFFNVATIILILICCIFKRDKKLKRHQIPQSTVGYFIPCYNESTQEINNSYNSFLQQKKMDRHMQFFITVCDGRKQGAGNTKSTDKILIQDVFPNSKSTLIKGAYLNGEGVPIDTQILTGTSPSNFPYFVIIKNQNQGKRDSITIMRRLLYAFNTQAPPSDLSWKLVEEFSVFIKKYGINKIDFVIGVDADTSFLDNCSIELLKQISRKQSILATTGMVKVSFVQGQGIRERIWEAYQHVQYVSGQAFLRNQQNLTQRKLNCLPGCLNITRVCQQTCGQMLLSEYMKPAQASANIFQQIRATASEDRHSVMLLLKYYRDCYTTVNWKAEALTAVPTNISVFLSQRRRWSLGSATHGMWMVFMPNIPIWERFSSFVFVLTYLITPFFMYSLATWITVIARGNYTDLFWILTGIVQIVTLYKLLVPLWLPMTCKQIIYYYLFYPVYYVCSPIMGMMVLFYSMYNMDDFGWGKTRTVIEAPQPLSSEPAIQFTLVSPTPTPAPLKTYEPEIISELPQLPSERKLKQSTVYSTTGSSLSRQSYQPFKFNANNAAVKVHYQNKSIQPF